MGTSTTETAARAGSTGRGVVGTYYVKTRKDGRTQGPFTADQLKALAAGGKLKPHYLVSKDGETWYLAQNIQDLPAARSARPEASTAGAAAKPTAQAPAPRRVPARRRRPLPVAAVIGLASAIGTAGLVGYIVYRPDRTPTGQGDGVGPPDPNQLAANVGGGANTPPRPPAPKPGGGNLTGGSAADPPAPRPDPGPGHGPPSMPRPEARPEPPVPPRSFEVLSVAYAGQTLRAMGSELLFKLTNKTGKDIRSVQGQIRLYGPAGAFLVALPVEIREPIAAGATVEHGDVWLSVGGTLLVLLEESSKQMKYRFTAEKVTYADGETEAFR